jgi:uncharacterized metal-binding protein
MKELWTATVEIMTLPTDSGNTKAFTNIVAWAESAQDYGGRITELLAIDGCSVLTIENCIRVAECNDIPEELERLIERAKTNPLDCIFGTLHYYPSKLL